MSEGALEDYPALRKHDDSKTAPVCGGVHWLLSVITECRLLSLPYLSLCGMEQKGCPHSLTPHFVPNGAMEKGVRLEQNLHLIHIQTDLPRTPKQIFK